MTNREVLTLEKAKDRMESEALPMMGFAAADGTSDNSCSNYSDQDDPNQDDEPLEIVDTTK